MLRKFPRPVKRIVVKVGSSTIASYRLKPRRALLRSLVAQISALCRKGTEVVLVSSGAIALGMGEQQRRTRPVDVASLQALAAVGQVVLMRTYSDLFQKDRLSCAQVLLTWDDFSDRVRFNNARNTIKMILSQGAVPVINENDTISTEEIKFGDNDKLSAFVSSLVRADLLVILSDVEGFYAEDSGRRKVFREIRDITGEIESHASGTANNQVARGGMSAKLGAIQIATHANIPCIIANGRTRDVLPRILNGERIGTLFMEKEKKLLARKHWISFGAKPRGLLIVDDGAREALLKGGRSLLLPGIAGCEGHFKAQDVVVICDRARQEIARGVIGYASGELEQILREPNQDTRRRQREVVHCDNMVLCER